MNSENKSGVVVGGFGGLEGLPPEMRARRLERYRAQCESKGLELVQVGADDWVFMLPERKEVHAAA